MAGSSLERFGAAEHGVRWALSNLPQVEVGAAGARSGDLAVTLSEWPGAEGGDDWSLRFGKGGVSVLANSAVGTISAVLELAAMLREGRPKNITRRLRFRTRNYKHELQLADDGSRTILHYGEAMWENLMREVVRRQFNGLVIYPNDYHPFAHLLDYEEFPFAAERPAAERAAVREALNRMLAVAHRYGLKTFMQHYVGHFTREMGLHLGIRETPSGRLSDLDHPEIDRYCGWCYREIYRQVPELDGLYFNFESSPNALDHVRRVAIPEFAKMTRKPICVFRLWGVSNIPGMKALVRAAKAAGSRVILGHKIADTSDTYHYPSADSRVLEWHKIMPGQEFMFLIGPCHNSGTNLCGQLWADYEYVQTLIGDARRKGTDSFSFHSVYELLAQDAGGDVWGEDERTMSRYNVLHLDAVVDYVNGRSMTRRERAPRMAARIGATPKAGRDVLELLEATSRLVITVYEQFYTSLAWEGFLTSGRYSHIQDPFYYYPSNYLNNTRKFNVWTAPIHNWSWIPKTIPVRVAPDDEFQAIIDYVDPAKKRKVRRDPRAMAALLGKATARSLAMLQELRKQGLGAEADRLEKHVKANALLGKYGQAEILAAIELYSLYFPKTRAAMLKALRKGLAILEPVPGLVEQNPFCKKTMTRVLGWDWIGMDSEVRRVRNLLATVEGTAFPPAAFQRYAESHRQYNEIRRYVRDYRLQNTVTMGYAARQLKATTREARAALALLEGPGDAMFRANVQVWLDYLGLEAAHMTPPSAVCPRRFDGTYHPMFHDDCFRMGEHFTEDFASFFKPYNYARPAGLSFAIWNTGKELAIAWREQGIDIAQRTAQWEKYRGSGSDVFVSRAVVDTGDEVLPVVAWPMGEKVSIGRRFVEARTEFTCDATSWQTVAYLPYSVLGKTPKAGDVWRFNVTANPYVARNLQYTWAPQYDCEGSRALMGRLRFE